MRPALLALLSASLLAAQPLQLFNGKDLAGWRMVGPGRFVVQDGLLKTEGGMGLLYYTARKFGNQTIKIVFKATTPTSNSGVFIRLPEEPVDPWYAVHNGYEVQIDEARDEWHSTGSIYSISKAGARPQKPGAWNEMEIQLQGLKTTVSVNGQVVSSYADGQPAPERKLWYEPVRGPRPEYGYIGLQNHDAKSTVYFREISVSPAESSGELKRDERNRALSYLHATRKQLLDLVLPLTDAQWKYKPSANGWSVAEIAEHLALAEAQFYEGAHAVIAAQQTGLEGKRPTDEEVTAFATNRTAKQQAPEMLRPGNRFASKEEWRETFNRNRDRNVHWIDTTPLNLRAAVTKFPAGIVDAYQLILIAAAHSERHLAQMREVVASPGFPKK